MCGCDSVDVWWMVVLMDEGEGEDVREKEDGGKLEWFYVRFSGVRGRTIKAHEQAPHAARAAAPLTLVELQCGKQHVEAGATCVKAGHVRQQGPE